MVNKTKTKTVTKEHIIERIDDWEKRIDDLYSIIDAFLTDYKDEYSIDVMKNIVYMNEELMKRFKIPPKFLDTLTIKKNDKIILTFKPYALWIFDANGRIDISGNQYFYQLIDLQEEQFNNPKWAVFPYKYNTNETTFSKDELIRILREND